MTVRLLLITILSIVASVQISEMGVQALPQAASEEQQSQSASMMMAGKTELKGRLLDEYQGEDWELNKPPKQEADALKQLRSGMDENWSRERRKKVHAAHTEELLQKVMQARSKRAELAREKHLQYSNMVPPENVPDAPPPSTLNRFAMQRSDTAAAPQPQQQTTSKEPRTDLVLILLRATGAILLLVGLILGVRKLVNKAEKMVQVETLRSGQELEVLTSVKLSQLQV